MKKRVYYNLHRKQWSVQHYIKGRGWRVEKHVDEIWLYGVTWKVYETGRQRVLKEGKKNVHAYGVGNQISVNEATWLLGDYEPEQILYNPYRSDSFYRVQTLLGAVYYAPQEGAELVHFRKDRTVWGMGSVAMEAVA